MPLDPIRKKKDEKTIRQSIEEICYMSLTHAEVKKTKHFSSLSDAKKKETESNDANDVRFNWSVSSGGLLYSSLSCRIRNKFNWP